MLETLLCLQFSAKSDDRIYILLSRLVFRKALAAIEYKF